MHYFPRSSALVKTGIQPTMTTTVAAVHAAIEP
jgi:hypothetical protein